MDSIPIFEIGMLSTDSRTAFMIAGFFFDNCQGDDQNVYFNSPVEYMSNLSDEWYIERYRQSEIFIYVGQSAWEEPMIIDSARLKEIFEQKNTPAFVDFWGHDVNHDWPWWQKLFPNFLNLLLEKRIG